MGVVRRVRKLQQEQNIWYVLRGGVMFTNRLADNPNQLIEEILHRSNIKNQPDFSDLSKPIHLNLGCGMDYKPGFIGVDLNPPPYGITHDITERFPLKEGTVASIITEETLEHLSEEEIVSVLNECHRILEKGGLMRVGVPDYGSPAVREKLELGYDPDYPDHSTLTTQNLLADLISKSDFQKFDFKHYWKDGVFHYQPIDYSKGRIRRAVDLRNDTGKGQFINSSIIVDLAK